MAITCTAAHKTENLSRKNSKIASNMCDSGQCFFWFVFMMYKEKPDGIHTSCGSSFLH